MTKEMYNKAAELDSEINRLDMLINYVEKGDESDILINPKHSDFAYLVYLLGVEDVLGFLRTRKRMLEKEFEKL